MMGCAHGAQNSASTYHFVVKIPKGWWQLDTDKYFLITKDNPYLQYALIQERPIDKAFRHTKKKLKRGMLPQESAEVILDEIRADNNIINFELIQNGPATIDGHAGFKILFTYQDKDGSTFKTLYYGFINGNIFYNLRYSAAKRHYFQKDLKTFEMFLDSFRLIESKTT
mgnify:CR=1 FL=1